MTIYQLELYTVVISAALIALFCYNSKEKITQLMNKSLEEIKDNTTVEEEIKHLESQIEKVNKSLILIDHNVTNIALSSKKLIRNYQSKEQDLRDKFNEDKKDLQMQVMNKYHKSLLIEIIELASSEIINCKEIQDQFSEITR